jgi:hypothetical protein
LEQEQASDTGLDVDAAVDDIGSGLGFSVVDEPDGPVAEAVVEPVQEAPVEPPVVREAPKSWAKETHEVWAKLPAEAQAQIEKREKQILDGLELYKTDAGFGKTLKEAIAPFQQMLEASQIDAPKAVSYLLGAHQRLTTGSPESRQAAYQELGRNLGLSTETQPNAELESLRQQVQQLTTGFTQERTQKAQAESARIQQEVDAFAADTKAHPYFDEVSEDIARLIKAGYDLNESYEKAVWANPVTRAKEQSRALKEHEDKLRENARLDALKAKTARGTNVKSRETTRAPTEPLGTMEDTLKETLADVRARTH